MLSEPDKCRLVDFFSVGHAKSNAEFVVLLMAYFFHLHAAIIPRFELNVWHYVKRRVQLGTVIVKSELFSFAFLVQKFVLLTCSYYLSARLGLVAPPEAPPITCYTFPFGDITGNYNIDFRY